MERRSFVQAVTSAIAMSVTIGRDTDAAVYKDENCQQQLIKTLSDLDFTVKTIAGDKRLSSFSEFLKERELSQFLIQEVLVALTIRATYDNMSSQVRKSPLAVSTLMQYAPILDRAVLGMTTLIESFDVNEREEIKCQLNDSGFKLNKLQMRFRQAAEKSGCLHKSSINRMNRFVRYTTWRMRRQGVSSVIEESVSEVDRVGLRLGIDPQTRRAYCKEWSRLTDFFSDTQNMVAGDGAGISLSRTSKVGLIMLGVGLLASIFSVALAQVTKVPGLLFGLTGGVVVMIIGLITLLVGIKR